MKSYAAAKEISIYIALSEVNLLNSTKDDILDMEELFHMYVDKFLRTKFDALLAKKKKVLSLSTFSCISY